MNIEEFALKEREMSSPWGTRAHAVLDTHDRTYVLRSVVAFGRTRKRSATAPSGATSFVTLVVKHHNNTKRTREGTIPTNVPEVRRC